MDECASSPCLNGAVCVDREADYACACLFGKAKQENDVYLCYLNKTHSLFSYNLVLQVSLAVTVKLSFINVRTIPVTMKLYAFLKLVLQCVTVFQIFMEIDVNFNMMNANWDQGFDFIDSMIICSPK